MTAPPVEPCELPPGALLQGYRDRGAYADCYVIEVAHPVTHADFVEAFYTTALFKAERQVLRWFVSKPSTDLQARQLACGQSDSFAAWRVEGRSANQLLMCDFQGRTRSWLMVAAGERGGTRSTRLYFGSAVVPVVDARLGRAQMGLAFRVLLGFHQLYSRLLLRAASARLVRNAAVPRS